MLILLVTFTVCNTNRKWRLLQTATKRQKAKPLDFYPRGAIAMRGY